MQTLKVNEASYDKNANRTIINAEGMLGDETYTLSIKKGQRASLPEIIASVSKFEEPITARLLTVDETIGLITNTNLKIANKILPTKGFEELRNLWMNAQQNGFSTSENVVVISNLAKNPSGKNNASVVIPTMDKTNLIQTACYMSFNNGNKRA